MPLPLKIGGQPQAHGGKQRQHCPGQGMRSKRVEVQEEGSSRDVEVTGSQVSKLVGGARDVRVLGDVAVGMLVEAGCVDQIEGWTHHGD